MDILARGSRKIRSFFPRLKIFLFHFRHFSCFQGEYAKAPEFQIDPAVAKAAERDLQHAENVAVEDDDEDL